MTDTTITQVTEALDALTQKHVTEMAVKADQETVDATVEAVKAEAEESITALRAELEAATAELNTKSEELEARIATMPTIQKEAPIMTNTFEKTLTDARGQEMFGKSYNTFQKAVDAGSNVAGGRVDAQSPYYILEQRSIFRGEATVINTTAGAIKLPSIAGVTWAKENTVLQDGTRANGGTLANQDLIVNNWTTQNMISLPALEDIQDFDGMMVKLIAQKLAAAENTEAAAVLKAATMAEVATGEAAALPAAGDIVAKLHDMVASVGSAYLPNAKFYVSRGLYAAIAGSANTTMNFDPISKVMTLAGYEVVVVDVLDAGDSAADVSGYFGDMSSALVMASRKNLDVSRYEQHMPGSMTYFGDARFSFAGWDLTSSIVRLVTEA